MTPKRWQQIEELFNSVVELEDDERAAYLDRACAGDPELRYEVESLLKDGTEQKTPFQTLISEAAGSLATVGEDRLVGQRVGVYRIVSVIGRGGMAEVYRAVRDDDQYQKEVAVKLVKRGMISDFTLTRFRHERQILASLEHPNIARMLDGGTTDDGLPYFVMECVEGRAITEYCEESNLSIKQRLKLFRSVCAAVQHAHRNLVVHRDLKPSNILVTKDGVPKLLDFGIAKLLAPEMSPEAVTVAQTMTAMRLMTPDYASPEQVRGEPITTATDVYALGAVLYELLTGERAHQIKSHSLAEIERVVCEVEVERPSVVVGRRKSPAKLQRELAGDLDNIVLMSLRKEPERRYQSVEQLSEDIRRYLEGRPVTARQDTFGYRAGKFVRRHKVGVSVAATFLLLLIGVAVIETVQAARIARERDRANRVTEFLVKLFEVSDPSESRGNTVTARELLDQGAIRVKQELKGQPEAQAALMSTMGRVYYKLGLYDKATPLLEEALAIRRQRLGQEHPDVAATLNHMAELTHVKGDLATAERMYQEVLAIRHRIYGEEHAEIAATLNSLASLLKDKADFTGSEAMFRQALTMRRKLLGAEHSDVADSLGQLAQLLKDKGDHEAAEPLYREALAMRRRLFGDEHPDVAVSINDLAVLLDTRGKYKEAELLYRQALTLSRRIFGQEHPYVATYLSNLAGALKNTGRYEEAEPLYREALAMNRKLLGDEHQKVATVMNNFATLLRLKGEYAAAENMLRESIAMKRKLQGATHPSVAFSLQNLAEVLHDKGDHRAAEPLFKEALEIFQKSFAPTHWRVAESRGNLGACLTKLGRYQEAESYLLAAYDGLKAGLGNDHKRTQKSVENLARLYEAWGRPDDAARYRSMLQTN
ncbi:MAG: serine/threonine-protein kinase [Pyrinomonadaceae bacterium]